MKLWAKQNEKQTVELAGPTQDSCAFGSSQQPDAVLFRRGPAAFKRQQFSVANLSFQTLLNTYPDSKYASGAKALLKLPEVANCGQGWSLPKCNGKEDRDDRPR